MKFSYLKLAVVVAVLAMAPVSFIVRVSGETGLGQQFQVNKKGEF